MSMKQLSLYILVVLTLLATSCKKEYDAIYDVTQADIYPNNANKDKLKTPEQYVTVAYANLFQKALSINKLLDITDVILSIGDKEIAREVLISNFMNKSDVILPTDATMRADIGAFLDEAYTRFFVRHPSELEKEWMTNYIIAHPDLSAEIVYFSFAMANEYLFY